MALINSLEKTGNVLFRYRGQIPVVLFILAIPFVYWANNGLIENEETIKCSLLWGGAIVSLLGQIIRSIAIGTSNKFTSGRNTKEGQVAEALNTRGIYSTVRHPLYLGNYLMWIGIVIFTGNIYYVIIVSLLFWLYYERIMYAEERFLERKFGDQYMDWASKTPAFIPSFKNYNAADITFSLKTSLRREYSGVTATIIGFIFVEFLRLSFLNGEITWNNNLTIATIVALSISLILRSLKHYTTLLNEADRS